MQAGSDHVQELHFADGTCLGARDDEGGHDGSGLGLTLKNLGGEFEGLELPDTLGDLLEEDILLLHKKTAAFKCWQKFCLSGMLILWKLTLPILLLFFVLNFLLGVITGRQFSTANACLDEPDAAGKLYGIDLVGSFLGAFIILR